MLTAPVKIFVLLLVVLVTPRNLDAQEQEQSIISTTITNNNAPTSTSEKSDETTETELHKLDRETAICEMRADLREKSIIELQNILKEQIITSEQLVKCYLQRIEAMNPHLNAIIEINPDALGIAAQLDQMRRTGSAVGPLHGIPVLIKDTIATADKMETTAGSLALFGLKPRRDAEIVKKLRKAGAIIIGKANLSEFGHFRSSDQPDGWSGRGGQTKNVFVNSASPGESSSGSAVAVSANLVPISIGGETDGSIVEPACKASIVGLKPTVGRVSVIGVVPISETQDTVGPMAKTTTDAAFLFDTISKNGFTDSCLSTELGLEPCADKYSRLQVGVLRNPDFQTPFAQEYLAQYEAALNALGSSTRSGGAGVAIIDPIESANGTLGAITIDSEIITLTHEFKDGLNKYLRDSNVIHPTGNSIYTLADVIEHNKQYPDGYGQDVLIQSEATDGLHNSTYIAHRIKNQIAARTYIDFMMTKYNLDAIAVPTKHSPGWPTIPAIAGYPHVTLPAGFTKDGLAFGISFFGRPNSDELLLILAYKLEKVYKARKTSSFL